EKEWLNSRASYMMLPWLTGGQGGTRHPCVTDRKLLLWACGYVRKAWGLLSGAARRAVEVAEKLADHEVLDEDARHARNEAFREAGPPVFRGPRCEAAHAAAECLSGADRVSQATTHARWARVYASGTGNDVADNLLHIEAYAEQASLLREVFG